jgi:hypothetical protein
MCISKQNTKIEEIRRWEAFTVKKKDEKDMPFWHSFNLIPTEELAGVAALKYQHRQICNLIATSAVECEMIYSEWDPVMIWTHIGLIKANNHG